MNIKLPKNISYSEVGHDAHDEFGAFSPDYDENDIGKGLNLTVTLFGYQLDGEAIEILMNQMMHHLVISMANDVLNKNKKES